MANILAVPSVFATITAAEAARPATPTEQQIIEIDTAVQQKYSENIVFNGSAHTAVNNLIIRPVSDGIPPVVGNNTGTVLDFQDPFIIGQDMDLLPNNTGVRFTDSDCIGERLTITPTGSTTSLVLFVGSNNLMRNCILSADGAAAFGVVQYNAGSGNKFKGNFLKTTRTFTTDRSSVWMNSGISGAEIIDNIFAQFAGDQVLKFLDAAPSGLVLNGNLYLTNSDKMVDFAKFSTTVYATLAAMQAATSFEADAPTQKEYTHFPRRNMVDDLGITEPDLVVDINNVTRSGSVDIGPLSYIIADTTAPTWDTTTGIQTLVKKANLFLVATWNAATDAISSVSYNVYLREGSDPDSFGPGSAFFAFNTENLTVNIFTKVDGITDLDFTKANHVIVRAVDEQGNEDTNVVSLNVPAIVEATPALDIANAIRNRFKSQVTDTFPLSTQFDNAPFVRPTTGLWCRFRVGLENQNQVSLGSSTRFRYRGEAVAKLFGPLGKGDKDLLTAADFIENRFKALSVSGIVFRTPRVVPMGRDGKSWRLDVICPFQADNIV